MLVVIGVIALGAAFYLAYREIKPFRDVVNEVWAALKNRFRVGQGQMEADRGRTVRPDGARGNQDRRELEARSERDRRGRGVHFPRRARPRVVYPPRYPHDQRARLDDRRRRGEVSGGVGA
jgi:hypothetical protein